MQENKKKYQNSEAIERLVTAGKLSKDHEFLLTNHKSVLTRVKAAKDDREVMHVMDMAAIKYAAEIKEHIQSERRQALLELQIERLARVLAAHQPQAESKQKEGSLHQRFVKCIDTLTVDSSLTVKGLEAAMQVILSDHSTQIQGTMNDYPMQPNAPDNQLCRDIVRVFYDEAVPRLTMLMQKSMTDWVGPAGERHPALYDEENPLFKTDQGLTHFIRDRDGSLHSIPVIMDQAKLAILQYDLEAKAVFMSGDCRPAYFGRPLSSNALALLVHCSPLMKDLMTWVSQLRIYTVGQYNNAYYQLKMLRAGLQRGDRSQGATNQGVEGKLESREFHAGKEAHDAIKRFEKFFDSLPSDAERHQLAKVKGWSFEKFEHEYLGDYFVRWFAFMPQHLKQDSTFKYQQNTSFYLHPCVQLTGGFLEDNFLSRIEVVEACKIIKSLHHAETVPITRGGRVYGERGYRENDVADNLIIRALETQCEGRALKPTLEQFQQSVLTACKQRAAAQRQDEKVYLMPIAHVLCPVTANEVLREIIVIGKKSEFSLSQQKIAMVDYVKLQTPHMSQVELGLLAKIFYRALDPCGKLHQHFLPIITETHAFFYSVLALPAYSAKTQTYEQCLLLIKLALQEKLRVLPTAAASSPETGVLRAELGFFKPAHLGGAPRSRGVASAWDAMKRGLA